LAVRAERETTDPGDGEVVIDVVERSFRWRAWAWGVSRIHAPIQHVLCCGSQSRSLIVKHYFQIFRLWCVDTGGASPDAKAPPVPFGADGAFALVRAPYAVGAISGIRGLALPANV